jgi:oxygen-independent coproporphyrinogen-3 oxidase
MNKQLPNNLKSKTPPPENIVTQKEAEIPFSLYIHTPWCIQKCPYCDFNSHKLQSELSEEGYLQALIENLSIHKPSLSNRTIETIFIGGGTPSLLSCDFYLHLFEYLSTNFTLSSNVEITLEANPGTVEAERFKHYKEVGINRLSIGIQSFEPSALKRLGRIHDKQQAIKAIEFAQQAGFDNFNIDLMHGLPNQTKESAMADIETALQFSPPHLSWYQLTIEPNTVFYKQQPTLPSEEVLEAIESGGLSQLQSYDHYEISAFAQPGRQCQHNLNYWTFGDYLGIGAGAHSKITAEHTVTRFETKRIPKDYMAAPSQQINKREVTSNDIVFEFMLMASRLYRPIAKSLFEQRTGLVFELLKPYLSKLQNEGLMQETENHMQITPRGYRYLNEVQATFLT